MKIYQLFLCAFLPIFSFGQKLDFKGNRVDSIQIRAHINAYQFDEKSTTKGWGERLFISYRQASNSYIIFKHKKDTYTRTLKPDTISVKSKLKKHVFNNQLSKSNLKKLMRSLTYDSIYSNLYNQLDSSLIIKRLNKRSIIRVANRYKIEWEFKRKYASRDEIDSLLSCFLSIDTFKLYLNSRFDTFIEKVFDYTNEFDIWIYTSSKCYHFDALYPHPVKQPWYDISDTSENYLQPLLNLEINRALECILPRNFLLKKSISTNTLVYDYIAWYFERSKMIYDIRTGYFN